MAIGANWNDGVNGTDSGHVRVYHLELGTPETHFIDIDTDVECVGITDGTITCNSIILDKSPPVNNSDTGIKGEIRVHDEYMYVCIETNQWKRILFSDFT